MSDCQNYRRIVNNKRHISERFQQTNYFSGNNSVFLLSPQLEYCREMIPPKA